MPFLIVRVTIFGKNRGVETTKERLLDFRTAKYTAIVSDLHLCEEEPVRRRHHLWKRYKTREFFFDHEFAAFLEEIEKMSQGEAIELIMNGDIFDFDSAMSRPEHPTFRVSWLEKRRGLSPEREKSEFKISHILSHHQEWVTAVQKFLSKGHRVVFVIGNHDLELHFASVQQRIVDALSGDWADVAKRIRFVEWFYISNGDTLIEHGNQYDPYCMAENPLTPFIRRYNKVEVRVPFGNLATRFLINGMGFFNPHADSNYLMSASEYVKFFLKHVARAQPLLMLTWFWSSTWTLYQSFTDRLCTTIKDPLTLEDRIDNVAKKANATSRMVRELQELWVEPASNNPFSIMRELWLDRAFLVLLVFALFFEIFLILRTTFAVSVFWLFIPLFLFLPFFIFYSRNVSSTVVENKEPKEKILNMAGMITNVSRVIYGHTHIVRHEIIGAIEHLNSGTWSPAFDDVECRRPINKKTFVWLEPTKSGRREASIHEVFGGQIIPYRTGQR